MSIRINGLIRVTQELNERFFSFISQSSRDAAITSSHPKFIEFYDLINQTIDHVDRICTNRGATPADLPNPSFRAYQWLKFLHTKRWLLAHLHACNDFQKITLDFHHQSSITSVKKKTIIRIYCSGHLYRSRRQKHTYSIDIHEGFILAPADVKNAIIHLSHNGITSGNSERIKKYTQQDDYKKVIALLNDSGGANTLSGKGKTHHLVDIYNQINTSYFNGQLNRPRLVWSSKSSRRRLGSFDAESGTITISRILDRPNVSELLVAFVMYHEMLHQSQGIKVVNGRRHAHTPQFKQAEKKFKGLEQAQSMIKALKL